MKRDFEGQKKELVEARRELREIKRENQQKSRECQEACNSLKELQNELMRKSMHVGSLGMDIPFSLSLVIYYMTKNLVLLNQYFGYAAFAIEGQVKEKSRWFSSLRDLTRKLKVLIC